MPGYNNPSVLELENDCLRRRLAEIKAAARDFSELVSRYIEPKKGDTYCSRNEVLRGRNELNSVLK